MPAIRPSSVADGSTKPSIRPWPHWSGPVESAVVARMSGRYPQGSPPSAMSFTVGSPTTSPSTRSGWVPANSESIVPASAHPNSTTRSNPAASMTARMSSMRSSSVATSLIRSDIPVPRLSNTATRLNRPSPSRNRANSGRSHMASTWEIHPGTHTSRCSPAPNVWYSMSTSPALTKRVSGMEGMPHYAPCATRRCEGWPPLQSCVGASRGEAHRKRAVVSEIRDYHQVV